MEERFKRNIGPITAEEQLMLNRSAILIAGCGGIGGYLAEYLARAGVGRITCVDRDVFDRTNLNRQLLATEATIGKPKAQAAAQRIKQIWPECDAAGIKAELNAESLPSLIAGADLALNALDNTASRLALAKACDEARITLCHGAVSGWKAQAALARPGGGLYGKLYTDAGTAFIGGVTAFTAAAAAALQGALAVRFLCGRPEEALIVLDMETMSMDRITLD